MPGGENGKEEQMADLLKRNELAICVIHWSIPCAASSTIRTRVPQFKASAAAFLPSLY
jgi:hypothetical protein